MAIDRRINFKDLPGTGEIDLDQYSIDKLDDISTRDFDQKRRFITAIKWMRGYKDDGTPHFREDTYTKYVEWHRQTAKVTYADLYNFTSSTTGTLTNEDQFLSITIDGIICKPDPKKKYRLLKDQRKIKSFLNKDLYAQKYNEVGEEVETKIGIFGINNSGGIVTITCTNGVYVPESFSCQVSGNVTSFDFSEPTTPVGGGLRASNMEMAHGGPLFLPWHRAFIRLFELDLQKADEQRLEYYLGSKDAKDKYLEKYQKIILPYWDWVNDSDDDAYIWSELLMGGNGAGNQGVLNEGPFKAPDPNATTTTGHTQPETWSIYVGPETEPRSIERRWGKNLSLNNNDQVNIGRVYQSQVDDLQNTKVNVYDTPPYDDTGEQNSFRSTLEGDVNLSGRGNNDGDIVDELHNRIHAWVGGTMAGVPIAPIDPLFFLHHCNIDRLWAEWQRDKKLKESTDANPLHYPVFGPFEDTFVKGPFPGTRKTDNMQPWVGDVVAEGLSIQAAEVMVHFKLDNQALGDGYTYDTIKNPGQD